MSTPAARIGDAHTCPAANPNGTPHVGGPITGPGCPTVKIGGLPAATVGDACFCTGQPDSIKTGTSSVLIVGKPAARLGDRCAHGGVVSSGCGTVLIGGRSFEGDVEEKKSELVEPFSEEQIEIINQAIKDCVALLERKLALLREDDPETLVSFKMWFGMSDEEAKRIILKRIRRGLKIARTLTIENFDNIIDEDRRKAAYAELYPDDNSYKIFLGNHFWTTGDSGLNSRGGLLIHELSHSKKVGSTFDHADGEENCLRLANVDPSDALSNADSFEYFMET